MRIVTMLVMLAVALMQGTSPLSAQDGPEFYRGKVVTVYVGFSPGGGYDRTARLLSRHMGQYIPGNPTLVVQNMLGAGGMTMTNYVASVAPRDGLHIAAPQRDNLFDPLFSGSTAGKFDPAKVNWIGSTSSEITVALASRRSGIQRWQDLRERELVVAGITEGTESATVANLLRNLLGLKVRIILGYPGTAEINAALQTGEVDGRAAASWSSVKPYKAQWIDSGDYALLFQVALEPHADLPDVPLLVSLAATEEQRKLLELASASAQTGRPFFVADGVPSARMAVLRKAFQDTMRDVSFLAEAEKQNMEVSPAFGAEMQTLIARVYATPKALLDKLIEMRRAPK